MLCLCNLLVLVSYNNINYREMQTRNRSFTHHHFVHISPPKNQINW